MSYDNIVLHSKLPDGSLYGSNNEIAYTATNTTYVVKVLKPKLSSGSKLCIPKLYYELLKGKPYIFTNYVILNISSYILVTRKYSSESNSNYIMNTLLLLLLL